MKKKKTADPNKIYIYKFPGDTEFKAIAMDVDASREKFNGICFLTPPDRAHMIEGRIGKQTEHGFTFISKGFRPGEWEFEELTYDVLKAGFYKHIYAGEKLLEQVHNTQELQDYYHENFPDYT